jgi:uncharacterized protein YjbJ (UPF0337 family)
MSQDIAEGDWKQFIPRVKEDWDELTNEEIMEIKGRRDNFIAKLGQKYGMQPDEAGKEWDRLIGEGPEGPEART